MTILKGFDTYTDNTTHLLAYFDQKQYCIRIKSTYSLLILTSFVLSYE